MQVTSKKINAYTVELTIKESYVEFQKAKQKVLQDISTKANIKWFRKWATIPEEVLIKQYWEQVIENETIDALINSLYPKVLKKENLVPTWPATFKELKSTNPFEIVLEVEILPEIEIDEKKVKKIKIKKQVIKTENNEVEDAIKEIEKRFTTFSQDDNAVVELWDRITIDTIGHDKKWWKEIPETRVMAFPLVIGSWSFIPWFEDKLIWSKLGDKVEFDITFPKDYHSKEFQSKKVFFIATILKIEKAKKPEWTEDFIEKLRGVKTDFEWFKKVLEDEILWEKERRARLDDEAKLLEELEKACKIELWTHLLQHEIDRIFHEHAHELESQWINLKHYLEHLKKDEETFKKEVITPEATRRLKAELILEKLKTMYDMEVTEQEINDEIDKIMTQYASPDVKEKLKAKLIPWDTYYEDIKSRLKYKKIIDTFFE